MVAHFPMRTYGVNQAFRCVEGIWLNQKSRQARHFFRKRPILHHNCETCAELRSYIRTVIQPTYNSAVTLSDVN